MVRAGRYGNWFTAVGRIFKRSISAQGAYRCGKTPGSPSWPICEIAAFFFVFPRRNCDDGMCIFAIHVHTRTIHCIIYVSHRRWSRIKSVTWGGLGGTAKFLLPRCPHETHSLSLSLSSEMRNRAICDDRAMTNDFPSTSREKKRTRLIGPSSN